MKELSRTRLRREAGPFRITLLDYRPGSRQRTHRHATGSVTIILGGQIRESTRDGQVTGSALSVAVKPAGVLHADEVGPQGARTLQIAFSPELTRRFDEPLGLDRWRWLHACAVTAPLMALALALRRPEVRTTEIENRVTEAITSLGSDPQLTGSMPPAWLVRVKDAVDDQLETVLSLSDLASLVGAHPVSVSRAFRRYYGRTMSEYRRTERLRRAAGRIADSKASLARIAHDAGYADQPHLCREFRRFTGVTPSGYRQLAS